MPTLDTTRTDQVTVEAETVEKALVEVSAQLGSDAEIMRAQKVHRGGVGGFFAKEMVQLTARKRRTTPVPLRQERPRREQPGRGGIADVLERLAQDADAGDGDFRSALERELAAQPEDLEAPAEDVLSVVDRADEGKDQFDTHPVEVVDDRESIPSGHPTSLVGSEEDDPDPVVVGPVLQAALQIDDATHGDVAPFVFPSEPELDEAAASEAPQPEAAELEALKPEAAELQTPEPEAAEPEAAGEPAPVDAPEGMGPVAWSTTALLRLGMPGPVIAAAAELGGANDLEWVAAIADAVAPHCGQLPVEEVIIVGPHAERLAEPLGLPLVNAGDMAPYDGSFCAMVEDTAQDRAWLEYVQGGRGIHLVIGDEPWQDLLVDEPVAVSWVGENAVADALYLAFTLGATLGFGTVDGFVSSMVRVQPTDVALAIRRVVGRQ